MDADTPPEVRSRFIRTLIKCPVCGKPIGERLGNKWWFMNRQSGTVSKVVYEQNQSTPYGDYRVSCPDEKCPGGCRFVWINEEMKLG